MNFELMLKNILTPLIALTAAWLARKLPFVDAATWAGWIDGLFAALTTGVLAWFNRPSNIIDAAGKQAGTTVITDRATANSLPNNPDVIATTPALSTAVNNAVAK